MPVHIIQVSVLNSRLSEKNKNIRGTGCKESQFYSLPFRQAVASMY